jgi:DNA helicase HerA-like ATPase
LSQKGITFTVLDKHGDIYDERMSQYVNYYLLDGSSKIGINPLNPQGEASLKTAILSFISLINELSKNAKLGHEQEFMLFNAINEVYYKNSIREDTYREISEFPDLNDLIRLLLSKRRRLLYGEQNTEDIDVLYELHNEKTKLLKLEKRLAKVNKEDEKRIYELEKEIRDQIDTLVSQYRNYLEKGLLNDKDCLIYTNHNSLLSLINRLQNLNKFDIFLKKEINYYNGIINIKSLDDEQKKIVSYYVLQKLYARYTSSEVINTIKHYVVIDEAQYYMDVPKILELIKKIIQEGRKFGLGLILATQNPLHFDTDILLNSATKIILSIDPIIQVEVSKKFGIDFKLFQFLKPRETCLYSAKSLQNGKYYVLTRK